MKRILIKRKRVITITVIPVVITIIALLSCNIQPRNTITDCRKQCKDSNKSRACYNFCECIHTYGHSLDSCLNEYNKATGDTIVTK